jgi:hypothetical protein
LVTQHNFDGCFSDDNDLWYSELAISTAKSLEEVSTRTIGDEEHFSLAFPQSRNSLITTNNTIRKKGQKIALIRG